MQLNTKKNRMLKHTVTVEQAGKFTFVPMGKAFNSIS